MMWKSSNLSSGGTVGSIAASWLQGPCLIRSSGYSCFTCFSNVCVGPLHVLHFQFTYQKDAGSQNSPYVWTMSMWMNMYVQYEMVEHLSGYCIFSYLVPSILKLYCRYTTTLSRRKVLRDQIETNRSQGLSMVYQGLKMFKDTVYDIFTKLCQVRRSKSNKCGMSSIRNRTLEAWTRLATDWTWKTKYLCTHITAYSIAGQ